MIKTPCEIVLWDFLPSLRRELVSAMAKNGLEREEIAEIFDMSEAAVCQYLKLKRGTSFRFDENTKKQIEKIAVKIAKSKKKEMVIREICGLCSMLKKQKVFCELHLEENPFLFKCDLYRTICLKKKSD